MTDPNTIRRRTFLGACTGIGAGILSGCTDGKASDTADLDTDTEVKIKADGPALELIDSGLNVDSIAYGDEFTVSIALANVGNEPIRSTSLKSHPSIDIVFIETNRPLANDVQGAADRIELESGETTTLTLGPFDAIASGRWMLRPGNQIEYVRDDAKLEFDIEPRYALVGEPFKLMPGVSMTVERFRLLDAYFYEHVQWWTDRTSPVVGMETTADKHLFAIPELTIQNETPGRIPVEEFPQKQYQLGTSQFAVEPDESKDYSGIPPETPWIQGEYLHDLGIQEGETRTTWMRSRIDVDRRSEIAFEYRKRERIGPPEVIVEIAGASYPQFKLLNVIAPNEWTAGKQQFGVEVKNVGDGTGEFYGTVEYAEGDDFFGPIRGFELSRTVEPGETAIETVAYDNAPETRYRFMPFGKTIVV
jgi:hypothetical protein